MKLINKLLAEGFGTFVLVLGGCGTALFGHVGFLGVAVAFGLTVIAMAYGIGHVSGAHLNPAVSFGVFVNGYWCNCCRCRPPCCLEGRRYGFYRCFRS